jgi:hypothetical protein
MIQLKMWRASALLASTLATWLIACGGCGGGAPSVSSSTEEATVHGAVRINGKPAKKGTITFDPANVQRKSASVKTADIGTDGTYTVKTLVGENRISVVSPETRKDPKLQYNSDTFDVKSGDNAHDVEIPSATP